MMDFIHFWRIKRDSRYTNKEIYPEPMWIRPHKCKGTAWSCLSQLNHEQIKELNHETNTKPSNTRVEQAGNGTDAPTSHKARAKLKHELYVTVIQSGGERSSQVGVLNTMYFYCLFYLMFLYLLFNEQKLAKLMHFPGLGFLGANVPRQTNQKKKKKKK
eukprot:319279_1